MVCRSYCCWPPTEWTGRPVSGHVARSLEEGNALRKYRAEVARWMVPVSISKTYAPRGACRPAHAHVVLRAREIRPAHAQSHASRCLIRKGLSGGAAAFYRSSARDGICIYKRANRLAVPRRVRFASDLRKAIHDAATDTGSLIAADRTHNSRFSARSRERPSKMGASRSWNGEHSWHGSHG